MGGDLTYQVADGSLFELTLPAAEESVATDADTADGQSVETPLSWSSILS